MKTRTWILTFTAIALLCAVLTAVLSLSSEEQTTALIYSDGTLVQTVDLTVDNTYRISFGNEWNEVTVCNGSIAVTAASCSSKDCVHHGAANSGAPIVCLPNRLVIEFTSADVLDAVIG